MQDQMVLRERTQSPKKKRDKHAEQGERRNPETDMATHEDKRASEGLKVSKPAESLKSIRRTVLEGRREVFITYK